MAPALPRPRLGISACLLGQAVRYDGRDKRNACCIELLGPLVEWVPVCPEVEVGMPVPRPPIRLTGPLDAPRLVADRTGQDWTEAMAALAARRVAELIALDLCGFVVKKDSPSCGLSGVPIHDGGAVPREDGVGAFTRVLVARMPRWPIEEEDRLEDPLVRQRFVERVLAYARARAAR